MEIVSSLLVICVCALIFWGILKRRNPKDKLPGPFNVPILGSIPALATLFRPSDINVSLMELFPRLTKKWGNPMALRAGPYNGIIVDEINVAKRILASDDWDERIPENHFILDRTFGKPMGILLGHGDSWTEMRRFFLKTMGQLGFNKSNALEILMEEEMERFLPYFNKRIEEGKGLVNMNKLFNVSMFNIIWKMLAGIQFEEDDEEFLQKRNLVQVIDSNISPTEFFVMVFPYFRSLFPKYMRGLKAHEEIRNYLQEIVHRKRIDGSYKTKQETYVDAFLHEMEVQEDTGMEPNYYTEEHLLCLLMDFFITGSIPSGSVEYLILFMIQRPHIQTKCQEEIDAVIGSQRFPSMSDYDKMPYNQAVVLEFLRRASVLPMISRKSSRETILNGVSIKKDTFAVINLYQMHNNESIWESPEVFDPERFLDENREIKKNLEFLLPFGGGRRACPFEVFARITTFFYLTSLLQNYRFERPAGHPCPDDRPIANLGCSPKPFTAFVTKRKH